MKVAVACGGTGGHIFPGVATADVLRARGHDVTLWLAGKDVEHTAVKSWPGPVVTVAAKGFEGFSLRSIGTAWRLFSAIRACRGLMRANRPDVLLAMGSYASVGPVGAARWIGVPYVLHEANVIPGRAVSLFANKAAMVAACFEETRYHMRRREIVVTGMPLRQAIVDASAKCCRVREPGAPLTLLVMGGSRGARAVNDLVSAGILRAAQRGLSLRVLHLTGPADEARVRRTYEEGGIPCDVRAFTHDMPALFAAADLAICRSGAATCAELSAFGLPSLLVPYPHAARDHQMANARAMERTKAADVVPEHDLTAGWLAQYLCYLRDHPARLEKMGEAARARLTANGTEALADLVERMGSGRHVRST